MPPQDNEKPSSMKKSLTRSSSIDYALYYKGDNNSTNNNNASINDNERRRSLEINPTTSSSRPLINQNELIVHHNHHNALHHDDTLTTTTDFSELSSVHSHPYHYHHQQQTFTSKLATATKQTGTEAIDMISIAPINILKQIFDEEQEEEERVKEEEERLSIEKLNNGQLTSSIGDINEMKAFNEEEGLRNTEILDQHHHAKSPSSQDNVEDIHLHEIIDHKVIRLASDNKDEEMMELDECHLEKTIKNTNPYNLEESGKPIKFQTNFQLCSFDECPDFLRNNPFIRNHYRKYFSYKLCLKSMFKLHNETVNIWTHFLPGLLYFGLIAYTIYFMVMVHPTGANAYNIFDMFILIIYIIMAINCFLNSTLYHTVNCHSHKMHMLSYRCDLSAISGLIGSSFIPALYFNLYCYVGWQIVYISSISLFALVGMLFPCLPFKSPRALKVFRIVRTVLFISMVVSAIIPISHWFIFILPKKSEFNGGFNENLDFMVGIGLTLGLYGVGLFFWLTKLPERLAPGYFDLAFSSHNIWHCFIVIAASVWYVYCLGLYKTKVNKLKAGITCPGNGYF
ncbi:hypothetical protein ABK040_008981 [Willaertia magna]